MRALIEFWPELLIGMLVCYLLIVLLGTKYFLLPEEDENHE